jgi:hypothetical protein
MLEENEAAWGGKSLEQSLTAIVSPPKVNTKKHTNAGRGLPNDDDDDDDHRASAAVDAETHFANTAGRPMNPSQKRTSTLMGARVDPWQPGDRGATNPYPSRCNLTHQPHCAPLRTQAKPLKKPFWHENPERASLRRVRTTPPWGDVRFPLSLGPTLSLFSLLVSFPLHVPLIALLASAHRTTHQTTLCFAEESLR